MAFPSVATSSSGNDGVGSASITVTLPTGIASGDVLVVWVAYDKNATTTWPAGWTERFDSNFGTFGVGSGTGSLGTRTADGTEGASITVTKGNTEEDAWGAYRITGASGNIELASASGDSVDPDPPNLTPSWGAKDTLWVVTACQDNSDLTGTAPTNYANNVLHQFNTDAEIVMGNRQLNAASENPGVFAGASDDWFALTIAIEPAGGGAFSVVAGGGSYSITGAAATLKVGKLVTAGSGTYSISGAAATLRKNVPIVAGSGSYSISGSAASLEVGKLLTAAGGVYTISGSAATLSKTIPIIAGGGSYSVSGSAATLLEGSLVAANSGVYTVNGSAASLEVGKVVAANGGSYAIVGGAASLEKGSATIAGAGVYLVTGGAVNFLRTRIMAANGGAYSISGGDATLTYTPVGAPTGAGIEPWWRRRRRGA